MNDLQIGNVYYFPIFYEKDTFSDITNECVLVHKCEVTDINDVTIHYTIDGDKYYMCGYKYWKENMIKEFKDAVEIGKKLFEDKTGSEGFSYEKY